MTKIEALRNVLDNYGTDMNKETRDELQRMVAVLESQIDKRAEQKAAKMSEYASAHDAVMGVLADATKPVTVAEIYESCQADLPEGFSKNKIAYALRTYWTDEVVKTEGKVNMYTKA